MPESHIHRCVEALTDERSLAEIGRDHADDRPLPSESAVDEIVSLARAIIFPGYFGRKEYNTNNLRYTIGVDVERLSRVLPAQIEGALLMAAADSGEAAAEARRITAQFLDELPALRDSLVADARAIHAGDPAAGSVAEVIYSYPAIRAITNYRVAHALHLLGVPVLPRIIAEQAHRETGIDIHPSASIGRSFMIDHGTGVVIGETAVIGDNVRIYQGVTLGARSFPTDSDNNPVKGLLRHPVIGNGVVIYANATILGRVHIGDGATIGGNVWLTSDVPAGAVVVQSKS